MPSETAIASAPHAFNVLLIYPRFAGGTFWNFAATCEVFGARYPAAPLGLITVAALLPSAWAIRLVDRNAEQLTDGDLEWADLVMTGGMLPQQYDTLEIIDICRAGGKPVVVGGPGVTSSPHIYKRANFRVLGEAEGIIDKFITAWEAGATEGVFEAEKFQVDVTKTPIPRFDLLKFDHYLHVGVQFSRGCPFTCEFCDIIELYGRVPRTKTTPHNISSIEMIHRLVSNLPEPRDLFRSTLNQCITSNPKSARWIVAILALYLHLGPFSRVVMTRIDELLERLWQIDIAPPAAADCAGPSPMVREAAPRVESLH